MSIQNLVRRTFAASTFYSSSDAARWRVERAGAATSGYGLGWFATNLRTGVGAWFPTWSQAQRFAARQAAADAMDAVHASRLTRRVAGGSR